MTDLGATFWNYEHFFFFLEKLGLLSFCQVKRVLAYSHTDKRTNNSKSKRQNGCILKY